jgi:predicted dehydrogenase
MLQSLRVAVIGAGHIGRLHAQKYAALQQCALRAVVDTDLARAHEVAQPLGAVASDDYRAILADVDAVSVAVPTALHNPIALDCLRAGVHVLVEKPFARTIAEADEMVACAAERGMVLQVGHIERFNSAVLAAREQVVEPLFIESHRMAPFRPRGTDVNVVLD